jgi:hypothetical protein
MPPSHLPHPPAQLRTLLTYITAPLRPFRCERGIRGGSGRSRRTLDLEIIGLGQGAPGQWGPEGPEEARVAAEHLV